MELNEALHTPFVDLIQLILFGEIALSSLLQDEAPALQITPWGMDHYNLKIAWEVICSELE